MRSTSLRSISVLLAPLVIVSVSRSAHALSKFDCKVSSNTGYVSGNSFPIKVVTVDNKRVERDTANAYFFMAHAAANAGVQIRVVSGFRTMAEQQYLYSCYVNCSCNSCNLAAVPGYSNHQSGSALDLNTASAGVYSWLSAHAGKYGFVRTVASEIWHWEYKGARPVGGPCGTLKAELIDAFSDAEPDSSGDADYRVCAGDPFKLWIDMKDVGTARWADLGMDAHYAGEGVGLEPAEGGADLFTGLSRVSLDDNVNANVHPKSWGGSPGGACNDAPKCRRTLFSQDGLAATAPDEPGIYPSSWQLHDHTPVGEDKAFGPTVSLSFRVETCAANPDPADPTDPVTPPDDAAAPTDEPTGAAASSNGCAMGAADSARLPWLALLMLCLGLRRRSTRRAD